MANRQKKSLENFFFRQLNVFYLFKNKKNIHEHKQLVNLSTINLQSFFSVYSLSGNYSKIIEGARAICNSTHWPGTLVQIL